MFTQYLPPQVTKDDLKTLDSLLSLLTDLKVHKARLAELDDKTNVANDVILEATKAREDATTELKLLENTKKTIRSEVSALETARLEHQERKLEADRAERDAQDLLAEVNARQRQLDAQEKSLADRTKEFEDTRALFRSKVQGI